MSAPLTRDEFADALRKGKGRAMAHVRDHGDGGIEDLLVDACVHSLTYDQQSEGHRGTWMMTMLSALPNRQSYIEAVLRAFAESQVGHDIEQMAGMVTILAEEGWPGARQALYDKFERQELPEDWILGLHVIELDGLDGLLRVARVLGRRLATDPDFWLDSYLPHVIEERFGVAGDEALSRAAGAEPDVQLFREAVVADQSSSEPRPSLDLDGFLAEVANGKQRARRATYRFARGASATDFQRLMWLAENEKDPERLAGLLHPFRAVDAPGGSGPLLPFARSTDAAVREAAIEALSRFSDDGVASFSAELLERGSLEGIRLLERNYRAGQFGQIARLLPVGGEDKLVHELGMDIIAACREPVHPEAQDCLLWIYEHTPCSFCRNSAITDLIEIGQLPRAVAEECRDDCNDETRSAVAGD